MPNSAKLRPVIPIEVALQRRRWLEAKYFSWYFLGYSAMIFWAEVTLLVFGTLLFFATSLTYTRLVPLSFVAINAVFAFLLTVGGLDNHSRERVRRFQKLSLRFHPVCAIVWWPWQCLVLFRNLFMRRQSFSLGLVWYSPVEPSDDDDVPAA
jgi:hypothetical protein